METCDNCRGRFDFAKTGTFLEPVQTRLDGPYRTVMYVPLRDGVPDMSYLAGSEDVVVTTSRDLAFCTVGCEAAWFEGKAAAILRRREERKR